MKNKLQNLLIDSLKLSIYPIFTQMENTKFPQNPTQEQLYELIRAATKQGMKDCENEKELLKRAATQVLHDQEFLKKAEKAHKETEELLEAINDVLDNHGDELSLKTYSVLQKFILLYKPATYTYVSIGKGTCN